MSDIVNKLWDFCHTLRHDGIDYGDYIEQITYLLFLKMADEKGVELPKGCDWPALRAQSGTALLDFYADLVRKLSKSAGILGDIFAEAQSRFSNAVNLKKLIGLIDETEWTALGVDVKAAAYEGLLEQAASEGKKGAGQYFTPRVLIQSICRCMKPDPRVHEQFTICDPACGTGGFLVAAYEWLIGQTKGGALEREIARRVRTKTHFGQDLVARPRRMALMNLYPTEKTWIYDGRTNVPGITKKDRPLTAEHFAEFEKCYSGSGVSPLGNTRAGTALPLFGKRKESDSREDRWRAFEIAEIKSRDFKLDSFKWLKEESLEDADELPEPAELATDAISELENAVEELEQVLKLLENGNGARQ